MPEQNSPAPISPLDIALGGEPLEVTYLDGRKETVTVCLHPIREYSAFLRVLADECLHAEFAVKREAGWALTLHPVSLLAVVTKSLDLNFPSLRAWAVSRGKVVGLLAELGPMPGGN